MTETTTQEIAIVGNYDAAVIFEQNGLNDVLKQIESEARLVPSDISTVNGRKLIASTAAKVARSKTAIDAMGKELVSSWKAKSKIVDAERKRARDTLDILKVEIRKPLTDWESKETERISQHEEYLKDLDYYTEPVDSFSSEFIQQKLDEFHALKSRDWEEFERRYQIKKNEIVEHLLNGLAAQKKYEKDQAELAAFRKAEKEREKKEYEEKLKAEAAEKAKAEAEEKARAEAEKERRKLLAIEQKKKEAEERAQHAEEERIASEARAKAEAIAAKKRAENERKATAEKNKAEAKERALRAEQEKEAAVKAERERHEAEKKAEAKATAKREANKKNINKIKGEIIRAFDLLGLEDAPEGGCSVIAYNAISEGKIPHIKIIY